MGIINENALDKFNKKEGDTGFATRRHKLDKQRRVLDSPGVAWLVYSTDNSRHADNIQSYARGNGHEVVYPYQTDSDFPQTLYIRCTADQLEAMEARSQRFLERIEGTGIRRHRHQWFQCGLADAARELTKYFEGVAMWLRPSSYP